MSGPGHAIPLASRDCPLTRPPHRYSPHVVGHGSCATTPNGPNTLAVRGYTGRQKRGLGRRWTTAETAGRTAGRASEMSSQRHSDGRSTNRLRADFLEGDYSMRIYYLDAPLAEQELEQLRTAVCGPNAATPLDQVRVPYLLPASDGAADSDKVPAQHLYQLAMRHLRRAGLDRDVGHQVAWVLPRDAGWSEIFQGAIQRVTGYLPVAVQRWRAQTDGTLERTPLCVMDMHGMQEAAAATDNTR